MSDPSVKGEEASAVAALHKYIDILERLYPDRLLVFETRGLSKKDLEEYERGIARGDGHDEVEFAFRDALEQLRRTKRRLFDHRKSPRLQALRQGPIGDCYFLSALGSFINRDPSDLRKMIKENRQGGKVVSYTVKFPNKALGEVTVSPPTEGEIGRYSSAREDGLWLTVMEKAYATIRAQHDLWSRLVALASVVLKGKEPPTDIHETIGRGGLLEEGMLPFTEKKVEVVSTSSKEEVRKALHRAFPKNKGRKARLLVSAATFTPNKYGLPIEHAYSIIGWDGKNVAIRNPWGRLPKIENAPQVRPFVRSGEKKKTAYETCEFLLSIDEFCKIFDEVAIEGE